MTATSNKTTKVQMRSAVLPCAPFVSASCSFAALRAASVICAFMAFSSSCKSNRPVGVSRRDSTRRRTSSMPGGGTDPRTYFPSKALRLSRVTFFNPQCLENGLLAFFDALQRCRLRPVVRVHPLLRY